MNEGKNEIEPSLEVSSNNWQMQRASKQSGFWMNEDSKKDVRDAVDGRWF